MAHGLWISLWIFIWTFSFVGSIALVVTICVMADAWFRHMLDVRLMKKKREYEGDE